MSVGDLRTLRGPFKYASDLRSGDKIRPPGESQMLTIDWVQGWPVIIQTTCGRRFVTESHTPWPTAEQQAVTT